MTLPTELANAICPYDIDLGGINDGTTRGLTYGHIAGLPARRGMDGRGLIRHMDAYLNEGAVSDPTLDAIARLVRSIPARP